MDFCQTNSATIRPELVISRPDQYVGIVTYTGDNSGTRDFRDFNFAQVSSGIKKNKYRRKLESYFI